MPQPFLDYLPSECSPRKDRGPFRGHQLPCSFPPFFRTHRQRPCYPRFHRLPRFWRSRLDSPRTMSSLFTNPKTRFLVALGHHRKDRPYRRLYLLRSLPLFTSPFSLARASPNLSGRYSPGFVPL